MSDERLKKELSVEKRKKNPQIQPLACFAEWRLQLQLEEPVENKELKKEATETKISRPDEVRVQVQKSQAAAQEWPSEKKRSR